MFKRLCCFLFMVLSIYEAYANPRHSKAWVLHLPLQETFPLSYRSVECSPIVRPMPKKEEHRCLITRKHVLTTALCKRKFPNRPGDVVVKMGSNNWNNAQRHDVKSWTTYAEWIMKCQNKIEDDEIYDIGVIELRYHINQNTTLAVTSITPLTFTNQRVVTVGWSDTNSILQTAAMKVTSKSACLITVKIHYEKLKASPTFLCTTSNPFIPLECGDNGSPLLVEGNKIIGINVAACLWGQGEVRPQENNIHLSVEYYNSYLMQVTGRYRSPGSSSRPNDDKVCTTT